MGLATGLSGLESLHSSFQAERLEKVMVRLWEYQRYYPIAGWSSRMLPTDNKGRGAWINDNDGSKAPPKEAIVLTQEWRWSMDAWQLHIDSSTDSEGWSYAIEPSMSYDSKKSMEHFVRRRLWQRQKVQRGLFRLQPSRSEAAADDRRD